MVQIKYRELKTYCDNVYGIQCLGCGQHIDITDNVLAFREKHKNCKPKELTNEKI